MPHVICVVPALNNNDRPFKDPNFDLRKAEQDVGVQAVALQVGLGEALVQLRVGQGKGISHTVSLGLGWPSRCTQTRLRFHWAACPSDHHLQKQLHHVDPALAPFLADGDGHTGGRAAAAAEGHAVRGPGGWLAVPLAGQYGVHGAVQQGAAKTCCWVAVRQVSTQQDGTKGVAGTHAKS